MHSTIPQIRNEIDRIDNQLLELINQRVELALKIGELKKQESEAAVPVIYRPEREAQILRRLISQNKGPLDNATVSQFFREVIALSRNCESALSAACLGPGTHSEFAAIQHFGHSVEIVAQSTTLNVFQAVLNGDVDYGVVPIENSAMGPVVEALNHFTQADVRIVGEIYLPIDHCFVAQHKYLTKIQTVTAHIQALGQCKGWLAKHVPHAKQIPASSNAVGAKMASEDPSVAGIVQRRGANLFYLKIIASHIEDDPSCTTRFFVINRNQDVEPSGVDKTTLLFHGNLDVESVLNQVKGSAEMSKVLKSKDIVLIDIKGHKKNDKVREVISRLQEKMQDLRLLGSYPSAVLNS